MTPEQRITEQAHTINDLLIEMGGMRRNAREAFDLLRDVPHALAHDRLEVALEFIDRAQMRMGRVLGSESEPDTHDGPETGQLVPDPAQHPFHARPTLRPGDADSSILGVYGVRP